MTQATDEIELTGKRIGAAVRKISERLDRHPDTACCCNAWVERPAANSRENDRGAQ
ncbi:MAG: hypothetical protein OXC07_02630 [Kistimonas sp.]|nr:hypothetical protein [Kistimonas sp.]